MKLNYRVWDKKNKKMYCWGDDFGYITRHGIVLLNNGGMILPPNVEIMVYIGILDENGKEICEGDLVKSGSLTQKVYYDTEEAAFKVKCINCHDEYGSFLKHWKGKIIGDIYRNPELLSEESTWI